MPNLLLIGPTNNGKSMLIEKFRRAHIVEPAPQAETETLPVVTMQMPSDPSVSLLCALAHHARCAVIRPPQGR
jgi:hypothetical protein